MKAIDYESIRIEDAIREIEEMSDRDYNSYKTDNCGVTITKQHYSSGRFGVIIDGTQEFLSESEDEVDAYIVGMRQGYMSARERYMR